MSSVAIVILNWNGKDFLEKFLPSVITCSNGHEIIVADNASSDDSVAYLNQNFPGIRVIQNKENGGFAKGYNDALKLVESDYYILLNSDIEVTEGWVEPMLEHLEKNKQIAGCQPKILAYNDKSKFEHAGASGGYLDKNYYPFCRGRIFEVTEEDAHQYDDITSIFWASGASLMIRSKVYHEAGGLDESFFAHMEEIDLCWRIQNMGFEFSCVPQSVVYHVGGGTLNYMNPKKTYLNFRNSLYMIAKNHKGILIFKLFKRLCLDGLASMKFLFSGDFKHIIALLKAHIHFYGKLGSILRKRSEFKKLFPLKSWKELKGLYRKNIILEKFLNGRSKFANLDKSKFN
jgi:GT2 family glycosyltransferase